MRLGGRDTLIHLKSYTWAPALKTEFSWGGQSDTSTFYSLNPPTSLSVSRSSPLLEGMAQWVSLNASSVWLNKHMASLGGDSGEAEGSWPEPAGTEPSLPASL